MTDSESIKPVASEIACSISLHYKLDYFGFVYEIRKE